LRNEEDMGGRRFEALRCKNGVSGEKEGNGEEKRIRGWGCRLQPTPTLPFIFSHFGKIKTVSPNFSKL